jgi:hypothetical protein
VKNADDLAEGWITYWQRYLETGEFPDNDENEVDFLAGEKPEACWAAILAILHRIGSESPNRLLAVLAAGPLEDLLAYHGEAFIDRVEAEARRDPRFGLLLGGVWQNKMSEEVWTRVTECRNAANW